MNYNIICGEARSALSKIESGSVRCCVTSPPYYRLRDYGSEGQIGLEHTPEQYIQKLVKVFQEVRRVLSDDGTLWVNIGDSYAGSGKGSAAYPDQLSEKQRSNAGMCGAKKVLQCDTSSYKRKELIGIPWMLAFALRADGWYLRQDIIWAKPNPMPESVKDRCTKSHEYIFLLTKSPRYYFDAEAIKEPAVGFDVSLPAGSKGTMYPNSRRRKGNARTFRGGGVYTNNQSFFNSREVEKGSTGNVPNLTGKRNKRDVWTVATRGYKGAHFATFPEQLITPCILAGTEAGDTVLDPFSGAGTTGIAALRNGRSYIGIEINPSYTELQEQRIKEEIIL